MNLLEEIQQHPICSDGSIKTTLLDHGVPKRECLEALCLPSPALVRELHRQYPEAGARMICTNTYGANAVHLANCGLAIALTRSTGSVGNLHSNR
jgi:methionine synthase I (cobalamin-dependent)